MLFITQNSSPVKSKSYIWCSFVLWLVLQKICNLYIRIKLFLIQCSFLSHSIYKSLQKKVQYPIKKVIGYFIFGDVGLPMTATAVRNLIQGSTVLHENSQENGWSWFLTKIPLFSERIINEHISWAIHISYRVLVVPPLLAGSYFSSICQCWYVTRGDFEWCYSQLGACGAILDLTVKGTQGNTKNRVFPLGPFQ